MANSLEGEKMKVQAKRILASALVLVSLGGISVFANNTHTAPKEIAQQISVQERASEGFAYEGFIDGWPTAASVPSTYNLRIYAGGKEYAGTVNRISNPALSPSLMTYGAIFKGTLLFTGVEAKEYAEEEVVIVIETDGDSTRGEIPVEDRVIGYFE